MRSTKGRGLLRRALLEVGALGALAGAVVAATLLTGCDEKPPAPTAPAPSAVPSGLASGAAAPTATASAAPAAVADASAASSQGASGQGGSAATAASPVRARCSALLPEAPLLRVAVGFEVQEGVSACPACGPQCNLVVRGKPFEGATVSYTCNEKVDRARMDAAITAQKALLKKAKPTEGFGRGGIHGEKDNGTFYTVLAFDDDTDCSVLVDWMRGEKKKTLELARMVVTELRPTMVVPPSK